MVALAREAQAKYQKQFDQQAVDCLIRDVAKVIYDNAEMLAREAVDETEMGVYEHKVAKNRNKAKGVWHDLHDKQSIGILSIDKLTGMIEVAKPIGVVGGITPMTNPIVTPLTNIIFALKTLNAMIISPHPKSKKCSKHAVELIQEVAAKHGVPEGVIQIIENPTLEMTQELMASVDVVVATGGMGMVKSAYSSGRPSFGVGAGNVQVILDRNIDFDDAAEKVITGRTFDNGIICSGEQSIIYNKRDREEVLAAFKRHGAYICNEEEGDKIRAAIFHEGTIARDIVGKDIAIIAKKAGISIPEGTRVFVVHARGIGREDIICKEKMCTVLAAFEYDHIEQAINIAQTNLNYEGSGHTAGIHSNNQANIIKAGSEISVSRLVVNAPCATTAGGAIQNGLAVTNTLGCGTWGGNSISENFTYKHLLNVTRIAPLSPRIHVPTDEEIWEL